MDIQIAQLGRHDYEETMDFINMVFSMAHTPTDFPELLPTYYKKTEEHMKCNYAAKCEGKIVAMVGIYPGEMVIGEATYKVARIGAVSVHPGYRNMGLMKQLMEYCMGIVKKEGYDLACLGGLRQRYMHYGFEKCGNKMVFGISKYNLKYNRNNISDITVEPVICSEDLSIGIFKELHDRKVIRFNRDSQNFFDICMNWKHNLYAGYRENKLIGYIVSDRSSGDIYEFAGKDDEMTILMLLKYFEVSGKEKISLEAGPAEGSIIRGLGAGCEEVEIRHAGNWHILNWEKLLESLLNVKNSYTGLQEGEFTIHIKGYGSLKISKVGGAFRCVRTEENPCVRVDILEAARLFFGPLQPYQTVKIPEKLSMVNSWFPLPLYVSEQDFA